MADVEAARCDVVRATSAETTETWRRCTAAWRLRRPWRSSQGMAFAVETYVAVVLEFVYIFQAYVTGGARRVSLRSSTGACRQGARCVAG
jgi:hypothetical protein